MSQLVENERFAVVGGGSMMMDENLDSDLIDLLKKGIEKKEKIFQIISRYFRKLINPSGLQPRKKAQKYNITNGRCIPTFYHSPDELFDFLE